MCSTVTNIISLDMVIKNGALLTNTTSDTIVNNLCNFKKILRYRHVIHPHPIRLLSHYLAPGISEVCTKHGLSISDVIGSNMAVLDHVVSHHRFKVSVRWTANHYLGLMSEFDHGNIFLGEPIKKFPDDLYEGHILGFLGVNVW